MKILLAVDDDVTSSEATLAVSEWFNDDATVVALHVGSLLPASAIATAPTAMGTMSYPVYTLPDLRTQRTAVFREARELASAAADLTHGTARTELGDPADTILRVAEEIDADLIVVGTGDRSWLSRVVSPSVSTAVTNKAPCSVLVVRPGATDTTE